MLKVLLNARPPQEPQDGGTPPHAGPIGSADSAGTEREKRSPRLDEIMPRKVHGFNARFFRGILT